MSAPANTGLAGARQGEARGLRRILARATALRLSALVVPGPEVARAAGLDLEAEGLSVAASPREANVLVVVGKLPEGLARAAAVAYAQMPRPRATLLVDVREAGPLPADVRVEAEQGSLAAAVGELRRAFREGAFSGEAKDFDAAALQTRTVYTCPMHPEVESEEPGQCPKCGMDLVPRESSGDGGPQHEHGAHEHGDHEHGGHEDHGEDEENGEQEDQGEHSRHGHADGGEGDEGDGESDGEGQGLPEPVAGEDFMSMVEMTQGTPRSSDGLQMEWVEVPFGPLLPGMPGGLSLSFTLDGDTVATAMAEPAIEGWPPTEGLSGPAGDFANRLARLDPFSPVAYRVLACKALEEAAGVDLDGQTALARVGAMERERAASHLGWLASFGHLVGYRWLEERAAELQLALVRAEGGDASARLAGEARTLARRVERTPLLKRRLGAIEILVGDAEASGPVARAGGRAADARVEEEVYRSLDFEPVILDGNNALSTLRVRLAEAQHSLELVRRVGEVSVPVPGFALDGRPSGTGTATAETPRGTASLSLIVDEGTVVAFQLDTPSMLHRALIKPVSEQREVADALVGIASLDLSPWEVIG